MANHSNEAVKEEQYMYPSVKEIDTSFKRTTLGHEMGSGSPCLKCGDACPGLDLHFWRKICKNCRCGPEDHDIQTTDQEHVRKIGSLFSDNNRATYKISRMTVPSSSLLNKPEQPPSGGKKSSNNQVTFEWVPQGTTERLAQRYMECLPKESQPIQGTTGAQMRDQQLHRQLPAHDQDPLACDNLTEKEKEKMNDFVKTYKDEAVGIGQVGEVEKKKPSKKSGGTQTNGAQTNGIGAGDKAPVSGGSKWTCERCNEPMKGGDVAVFAERAGPDRCWHPGCFRCKTCNELLVDLIYFYKDNDIFCGRHYADMLKPRCAACDEEFGHFSCSESECSFPAMCICVLCCEMSYMCQTPAKRVSCVHFFIDAASYTQAEDRSWHLKHFCCWECDEQLGGKSYVAKEGHPYCLKCHEKLFAKVSPSTEPFRCYVVKESHPFCLKCHEKLFAKVCHSCNQKIPAGAQRVTYEDLHWHAHDDCFQCSNCKKSLINQSFLPKSNHIFCSVKCKRQLLS